MADHNIDLQQAQLREAETSLLELIKRVGQFPAAEEQIAKAVAEALQLVVKYVAHTYELPDARRASQGCDKLDSSSRQCSCALSQAADLTQKHSDALRDIFVPAETLLDKILEPLLQQVKASELHTDCVLAVNRKLLCQLQGEASSIDDERTRLQHEANHRRDTVGKKIIDQISTMGLEPRATDTTPGQTTGKMMEDGRQAFVRIEISLQYLGKQREDLAKRMLDVGKDQYTAEMQLWELGRQKLCIGSLMKHSKKISEETRNLDHKLYPLRLALDDFGKRMFFAHLTRHCPKASKPRDDFTLKILEACRENMNDLQMHTQIRLILAEVEAAYLSTPLDPLPEFHKERVQQIKEKMDSVR